MRHWVFAIALFVGACQQKAPQLSFEGADYKTAAQKIAHGERLTQVLGCRGCHGENFQGKNMEDNPANGPMYSPNVTLVAAQYSDADFDRLLRHGMPKDGREFWFMQVESYQFLMPTLRRLSPTCER